MWHKCANSNLSWQKFVANNCKFVNILLELFSFRDNIVQLPLQNFRHESVKVTSWPASREAIDNCRLKGQAAENCHNYIRIILHSREATGVNYDQYEACGTNAFTPECVIQSISAKEDTLKSEKRDGKTKSPFGLDWNTTTLITSDGKAELLRPNNYSLT